MNWEYLKQLCDSDGFMIGLNETSISKEKFITQLEYLEYKVPIVDPVTSQLYSFPSFAPHSHTRQKRDVEADDANHLRENIAKTYLVATFFYELKNKNISGHEKFFTQYPTPKNQGMLHQLYATIYLKKFIKVYEIERGNKKGTDDNIDIVAKVDGLDYFFHVITVDQMKKTMGNFLISSQLAHFLYPSPLFTADGEKICPLGVEGIIPPENSKVTLKSVHLIVRESNIELDSGIFNKALAWKKPTDETTKIIFDFLHERKTLPCDFFVKLIFTSDKSSNDYNFKQYFKYMERKRDPITEQDIFVQTGKTKATDHFHFLNQEFKKRSEKIKDLNANHILMAFVPDLSNLSEEAITHCLEEYTKIKAIFFFTVKFLPNNKGIIFVRSKIYSDNHDTQKLDDLIK